MRIRVDHRTSYRYDTPATGLVQALRIRPVDHAGQHVIDWRVDTNIDGHFRHREDAFGNQVAMFYADAPAQELTIAVSGLVDVADTAGVIRAHETLPAEVYRRTTPLTEPDAAIAAIAAEVASTAPLATLHALAAALHQRLRFEVGATGSATTAAAALAEGRGVCQDFAHIFIAAARHLGLPARYVSGHLVRDEVQDAAHAWAEARVPGLGWVAFDPANGISPTEAYVRVAIGLDYLDAAPVRGARRGGGGEALSVRVDVAAMMRQSQS